MEAYACEVLRNINSASNGHHLVPVVADGGSRFWKEVMQVDICGRRPRMRTFVKR